MGKSIYYAQGDQYEAFAFTIKSPSEHTVNGKNYDLELQLFHKLRVDENIEQSTTADATDIK